MELHIHCNTVKDEKVYTVRCELKGAGVFTKYSSSNLKAVIHFAHKVFGANRVVVFEENYAEAKVINFSKE